MSTQIETPTIAVEIVQPGAVESIERAQIDIQISTAKRYPRDLARVKRDMMQFATLDQETAESCFYKLPRGGKNIEGPSVRLAEIALACYGNVRAATRVIATVSTGDNPHVVVQGVGHDLQSNSAFTCEKRRRIVGKKAKNGVPDEDDINLAVNSCAAIAFRDSIFKIIPGALIKPVFEAAKQVAIGDAKTLVDRRAKAFDTFAKMGVNQERVLLMLGKKTLDEVGLEELETLTGLRTAIKDGITSIDEAFPASTAPKFKSGGAAMFEPKADQAATAPPPAPPEPKPATALRGELAKILADAGFTWKDVLDWSKAEGVIAVTAETIEGCPEETLAILVRSKLGLLNGIKKVNGL